jgi:Ca2+-binding RTX toxin-like protein
LFDLLGVSRIDDDYTVAVGTDQAGDINRTSPYSWYYEGRGGGDTLTGDRYDTVGYASSPEAVRVDLSSVGPDGYLDLVAGGDAWGDRVSAAFSRVVGSEFGDHLTGDGRDNVLAGLDGDDGLVGGRGNDTLGWVMVLPERDEHEQIADYSGRWIHEWHVVRGLV